jgi:hypothetical protein
MSITDVVPSNNPSGVDEHRLASMGDAMELAMSRARDVSDQDPDPYGYGMELEQNFGVDLLSPNWKAKPDDERWVKRIKARARQAAVARLFLLGFGVKEISERVKTSQVTVYNDLKDLSREWRKSYLGDIETLAGQDLARLDMLLQKLAAGINRGDTKSITAALEIIKERGTILGYRTGVQVDIEQYVREVAEANGYDPDKAVMLAQRISITMK